MTQEELRLEALQRATEGDSVANYPAIYSGFMAKGIAEADIKPRENVLTFHAWKAKGRSVKKGEHGVKVTTFVTVGEQRDATGNAVEGTGYRTAKIAVVFHISQTEPTEEAEARWAQQRGNGNGSRNRYRRGGWRCAGYHAERRHAEQARDYVRDPGEDAADRWNETHGDRWIES
jgi:N-terminal domain of anti-restriction factor ArdC